MALLLVRCRWLRHTNFHLPLLTMNSSAGLETYLARSVCICEWRLNALSSSAACDDFMLCIPLYDSVSFVPLDLISALINYRFRSIKGRIWIKQVRARNLFEMLSGHNTHRLLCHNPGGRQTECLRWLTYSCKVYSLSQSLFRFILVLAKYDACWWPHISAVSSEMERLQQTA